MDNGLKVVLYRIDENAHPCVLLQCNGYVEGETAIHFGMNAIGAGVRALALRGIKMSVFKWGFQLADAISSWKNSKAVRQHYMEWKEQQQLPQSKSERE